MPEKHRQVPGRSVRRFLPALFLIAVLPYLRVAGFGFVFDDNVYLVGNAAVRGGLSIGGLRWAFTSLELGNWHPLTWVSHMADSSLFGMNAGAHHLVNVAFHASNVALLFLLLARLTGTLWRSLVVAAVFAVHPLHVESVAWVAERKNLLSGFLFLLALHAYTRYARRPSAARYVSVAVFFGLGLLAKPMVVTLPFVLLLLDFWPLGRCDFLIRRGTSGPAIRHGLARLLIEKVPLFLLSAGASAASYVAQHQRGAMAPSEILPLDARVQNALVSCAHYVLDSVWPHALAVWYHHRGDAIPLAQVAGATAFLAVASAAALRSWRRQPYLAQGWFWFLGMLVPAIGLVQVGVQARADRYMYLPQIGLLVAATWAVARLRALPILPVHVRVSCVVTVVVALGVGTWHQTGYWSDEISLFGRAVSVDPDNALARDNLGNALMVQGRSAEAVEQFRAAVRIAPHLYGARVNLGVALARLRRTDEAIEVLQGAIRINPSAPSTYMNLGLLYVDRGDQTAAREQYRRLLSLDPALAARLALFIDAPRALR